jgi:hypothetical protein
MLLRERVTTAPTLIISPQGVPVHAEIWAVGAEVGRGTETGTSFYVSHTKEACTRAQGVPIPIETTIKIDLSPGQALWAISSNEGFLGITLLDK